MFKNFALTLTLILCLCYYGAKPLFSEVKGEYSFYTQTSVSSRFITVSSEEAKNLKKSIKNLRGESVCFDYDQSVIDEILYKYNAKKVLRESGENFCSDYYYSDKIPYYQLIGGVKVNIQVAISCDKAVVGSPIIYGGF